MKDNNCFKYLLVIVVQPWWWYFSLSIPGGCNCNEPDNTCGFHKWECNLLWAIGIVVSRNVADHLDSSNIRIDLKSPLQNQGHRRFHLLRRLEEDVKSEGVIKNNYYYHFVFRFCQSQCRSLRLAPIFLRFRSWRLGSLEGAIVAKV